MNSIIISSRKSEEHRATSSACAKHVEGWNSKRHEGSVLTGSLVKTKTEVFGWSRSIVSRKWSSRITSCQFRSPRIGVLLDSNKTLEVAQVYAPTTVSDDGEVEEFCDFLESTCVVKSVYGCAGVLQF